MGSSQWFQPGTLGACDSPSHLQLSPIPGTFSARGRSLHGPPRTTCRHPGHESSLGRRNLLLIPPTLYKGICRSVGHTSTRTLTFRRRTKSSPMTTTASTSCDGAPPHETMTALNPTTRTLGTRMRTTPLPKLRTSIQPPTPRNLGQVSLSSYAFCRERFTCSTLMCISLAKNVLTQINCVAYQTQIV